MPEEVEAFKKSLEVKNTNKSTTWAVRAFYSWLEEHNQRSDEKCLSEDLCVEDKALLCDRLCIFCKGGKVGRWRRLYSKEYFNASEWTAVIHQFKAGAARTISEVGQPH